ncbi:MAG TPA: 16S rRNA (cytosine(967)-C(5))-methyltransferase RsmB [Steroidobacteraceae bacterium]|nr:16S rRNA (cytosine(967)-C(5))-methyltransferase RsmB [Steroidobacteraceae bacterium]
MARSRWAPGAPALAAAARAVDAVVNRGESADSVLAAAAPERAAIRAIALGTLRWYLRLAPALNPLLSRPAGVPPAVRSLMVAAAHQVEYSRNPPEATVHAAVDATRLLEAPRLSGLVNAVLRRFVAERRVLLGQVDATLAGETAHPEWLVERLRTAWPEEAAAMLAANNTHPPMTLRVDLTRSSPDDYVSRLAAIGIDAHKIQWSDTAVTLTRPVAVSELPGFSDGVVSVQDAGAQVAAALLDARPGMRVLDACAAPGGKTGHLLERLGEGADVTAVDVSAERVGLIRENLQRLGRKAELRVGDARDPASFWDGRPFERILVDAPCSSTGVIRRHPDIKLLRRPSDIPAFAATQLAILRGVAGLLAPGGRLLYVSCSVLPAENEEVVNELLAETAELTLASMASPAAIVPGARLRRPGLQLLPGAEAGTDGFYYACLEKTTVGA